MITKEQLASIFHSANSSVLAAICAPLNAAMTEFGIDTKLRQSMFLAQCAHESGNFAHLSENLHYRAETLLKVFAKYYHDAALATAHANHPELIANHVYSNRMGNGDEASGDGYKYRGRGLIQLTGKSNYIACGAGLKKDLIKTPEYLETLEGACRSAGWFWSNHGLNKFADKGDILGSTKLINGGTNGLDDRTALYNAAKKVLV